MKTLLTINNSSSSAFSSASSNRSSSSYAKFTPFSSLISSFFIAVHLAKVIIFRFAQSKAKCLNPWHLKHRILPRGLDLSCGGGLFCGDWNLSWVGEDVAKGLGGRFKLPLLKGWS